MSFLDFCVLEHWEKNTLKKQNKTNKWKAPGAAGWAFIQAGGE